MCSLFGWLDYQGVVPHKILKKLTQSLANAAEERGTDATGISYIKDGKVVIFKRPKAAHKLHLGPPEGTRALMGHTRMTTQGSEKRNQNNHPFPGKTGNISWSLAHNGCLSNDRSLRKEKQLPVTDVETDSYIAVQLIESQNKLDFDSLRYMAESVHGSFTFSLLSEDNSLYFVKGNNPLCLLHFKSLGLYIYASTETIIKAALRRLGFNKFAAEKIDINEGDILKIDKTGGIIRAEFTPAPSYGYFSHYKWWGDYEDYYSAYEETLIEMAHCFGADEDDVIMLLDYGYSTDDVEELLLDMAAFQEAVRDVRFGEGESLYSGYCYGGSFL